MNEEILQGLYDTYGLSKYGSFGQFKKDITSSPEIQQGFYDTYGLSKYGSFENFQKDVSGGGSSVLQRVGDYPIALAQGAVGAYDAVKGLVDLGVTAVVPTVIPGAVGKRLGEAETNLFGGTSQEAREFLQQKKTPEQQAAEQATQNAEGFGGTVQAYVENPSAIATGITESLPSIALGGAIGRGVSVATKVAPYIAGAIGEGLITTGAGIEGTRSQSSTGLMTREQQAISMASGVLTGAFGALGGKMAGKLGIKDIDTILATTKKQANAQATAEAAQKSVGLLKGVIGGTLIESTFEELPQSWQEQIMANIAAGKPWNEGVAEAAAAGWVQGAVMGGGAQIKSAVQSKKELGSQIDEVITDSKSEQKPAEQIVQEVEEIITPTASKTYQTIDKVPEPLRDYASDYGGLGVVVNAPQELIDQNTPQEQKTESPVQVDQPVVENTQTEVTQPSQTTIQPEAVPVGQDVQPIPVVEDGSTELTEGSTTELPPLFEGASVRKFQFTNGTWKQNVGGELTQVSPKVQEQADTAFKGQPVVTGTMPSIEPNVTQQENVGATTIQPNVTPVAPATETKTEQVATPAVQPSSPVVGSGKTESTPAVLNQSKPIQNETRVEKTGEKGAEVKQQSVQISRKKRGQRPAKVVEQKEVKKPIVEATKPVTKVTPATVTATATAQPEKKKAQPVSDIKKDGTKEPVKVGGDQLYYLGDGKFKFIGSKIDPETKKPHTSSTFTITKVDERRSTTDLDEKSKITPEQRKYIEKNKSDLYEKHAAEELFEKKEGSLLKKKERDVRDAVEKAIDNLIEQANPNKKGRAMATVIPGFDYLVYGSLKAVRAAYTGGKTLVQAVQAGIDWINSKAMTPVSDKQQEKYRAFVEEQLKKNLPQDSVKLAEEFNDSGVILSQKSDETSTEDARIETSEKIADFLRNKGVTEKGQIEDFVTAWNELGVEGARILNKQDVSSIEEKLTPGKKDKPFDGKTITVGINKMIERLFQSRIKGKALGVKRGQQMVNREIENLQEVLKKTNLNKHQISAILSKIKKTNFSSELGVENLRVFVSEAVNNSEFVDKVREAKTLRKLVKRTGRSAGKNLPANIRKIAKQFGRIDTDGFETKDKIGQYIEVARMIVNSTKPVGSKDYSSLDARKVTQFIDKEYARQQAESLRMAQGDLTEDEIKDILEEKRTLEDVLKEKEIKEKEVRDRMLEQAKYAEVALREVADQLTGTEKELVDYLISADKSALSLSDLAMYIRVADNIAQNKDFAGSVKVWAKLKAPQVIADLKKVRNGKSVGDINKLMASFQSVPQLIDAMFNDQRFVAKFMSETGMAEVLDAGSQTEIATSKMADELADAIKKIGEKHKVDLNDRRQQVGLMMLKELAAHYGDGTSHIAQVKTNIKESIIRYGTIDKELQKVAQAVYDKVFANVKSADEAIEAAKKQLPAIHEIWAWARENMFTDDFTRKSSNNTERVHNKPFLDKVNYTPTVFEITDRSQGSESLEQQKYNTVGTAVTQSPFTKEATRGLLKGQAYSSNPLLGMFNAYRKVLYDVNSAKAAVLAHEVVQHPSFTNLVGGTTNKNKFVEHLSKVFSFQKGVTGTNDDVAKIINDVTSILREYATGLALGGADQILLQTVPGFANTLHQLGKYSPHAFNFRPPQSFVEGVFKKSRTGVRANRRGGTDIGDTNEIVLSPELQRKWENTIKTLSKGSQKLAGASLYLLTKGDVNLARASWIGYYIKSLREQGVSDLEIDLNTEAEKTSDSKRKIAKTYADNMVSTTQAPSNTAEMSAFARSRGTAGILRNVLAPFSVFPLNFKVRMIRAINKSITNPREGIVELTGAVGEAVVYAWLKDYLLGTVYYPLIEAGVRAFFGVGEPEKDEEDLTEEEDKKLRRFTTRVVKDILPWSIGILGKIDLSKPLIDTATYFGTSKVDKEDYPTYKDWIRETGGFGYKPYQSEFGDLGLFGIPLDKVRSVTSNAMDAVSVAQGAETVYFNTPFGEKESEDISDMKTMIYMHALWDASNAIIPLPVREVRTAEKKVYLEQLKNPTPLQRERAKRRGVPR